MQCVIIVRTAPYFGLAAILLGILTACSSVGLSGPAPQRIEIIETPGLYTANASVWTSHGKNLYWSNGWTRLRENQRVKAGDIIRTSSSGFLSVAMPGTYSVISLLPGSTLAIEQLEKDRATNGSSIARLYLQEGEIRVRSGLRDSNSVEEVRTPFGVASSITSELPKRDSRFGPPSTGRFSQYHMTAEGEIIATGPVKYSDRDGTTNLNHGAMKQLPLNAEIPAKTCELHRIPMQRAEKPVVYGLISSESIRHLEKSPNVGVTFAGCVIHANSPRTKIIWVCSECLAATARPKTQ
jgi:hypothetical protein